jgi:hypothetical protein
MSYNQHRPAKSATSEYVYVSNACDAQPEATTSANTIVDKDGCVLLTPSSSTVSSTDDSFDLLSAGSLTPTTPLSPTHAPSDASSTAGTHSFLDAEQRFIDEFANLTFQEKHQALLVVSGFRRLDSDASSKAETEILTQTDAIKIGKDDETSEDDSKPSLEDWQALCKAVGVTDNLMPSSITRCKKVGLPPHSHLSTKTNLIHFLSTQTLRSYNANLCDLCTALNTGTVAQTFPSVAALARYSKREDKIASKAAVKKNPLLKMMLRKLFRGGNSYMH